MPIPAAAAEARVLDEERLYQLAALDLHDGAVQKLVWCRFALGELAARDDRARAVRSAIAETIDELRDVIGGLQGDGGIDEPLDDLLRREARRAELRLGLRVELDLDPQPVLEPAVARNAWRIAQEALANAARHGRARRALLRTRIREGLLTLIVADDGAGFESATAEARATGLGLRGMRRRAELCGGSCSVRSRPGGPTRVRAELPVCGGVEGSLRGGRCG
jgi:signal transduction histidine kinase